MSSIKQTKDQVHQETTDKEATRDAPMMGGSVSRTWTVVLQMLDGLPEWSVAVQVTSVLPTR